MFTNIIVNFFLVGATFTTTNLLKINKKAHIVTPVGSDAPIPANTQNYLPWPVPFFTDNQYGYNNMAVPITSGPPTQPPVSPSASPMTIAPPPLSTSASTMTPATIGRVNTINSSPALVDISSIPTQQSTIATIEHMYNPSMMLNYSTNNPNIETNIVTPKQNTQVPPLITIIDSKLMIQYSTSASLPASTIFSSQTSSNTTLSSTTSSSKTTSSTSSGTTSSSINSAIKSNSGSTIPPSDVDSSITVASVSMTSSTKKALKTSTTRLFADTSKTSANQNSRMLNTTSAMPTTPAPFTSNPIPVTPIPIISSTTTAETVYRPLGLDCNYRPPVSTIQIISNPGSELSNHFQVQIPAVVKFDVNITSLPNYTLNISPVPGSETDIVEIISANSISPQFVTTSNYINLDISHPDFNTGWTNPTTNSPSTTAGMQNKISQEKCLEYYRSGRRSTRGSQVQVFIIGGQSSQQKEFPHMAALGYGPKSENHNNNWLCGGSLISELFVVTAAHCLSAKSIGYVSYVRLGTTTLQTETLDSDDYNVVRRIPHPNYIEGKQYDDIALLELDKPVRFTEYIAPICLYTSTNLAGLSLVATGWGKTSDTGITSKDLQKVDLDYVPNNVCQQAYSVVPKDDLPKGIVEITQVCAGTADGTRDTCQGDSGGPLQLQQDSRQYLVGVTSFGIGCGTPGIPGVYTRVSYYVPWIEQTVWRR